MTIFFGRVDMRLPFSKQEVLPNGWDDVGKNRLRASWKKPKTVLKSGCFCLTSIELLGVSPSSARRLPSRNFDFTRSVFGFQISNLAVQFLNKKRLTAEMTWAETASDNVKCNGRRSKQSRCFRLTSNDLLGVSPSLERRRPSRNFTENAERLRFQTSNLPFGFFSRNA